MKKSVRAKIAERIHDVLTMDIPELHRAKKEVSTRPQDNGSIQLLYQQAFRETVKAGACPVTLARGAYHWPLRNSVVGVMCKTLDSPRIKAYLSEQSYVQDFIAEALRSLRIPAGLEEWRMSKTPNHIQIRLLAEARNAPDMPPLDIQRVSPNALRETFHSLRRALKWLRLRHSKYCPPAIRPMMAKLLSVLVTL